LDGVEQPHSLFKMIKHTWRRERTLSLCRSRLRHCRPHRRALLSGPENPRVRLPPGAYSHIDEGGNPQPPHRHCAFLGGGHRRRGRDSR
jgi:hypothetical protein